MDVSDSPSPEGSARFNDSLERCNRSAGFLEDFYGRFVASSPEVAARFAKTDLAVQARLLRVSLYLMLYASFGRDEWSYHLDRIAERHSRRGLDVSPPLYDLWLDCLVATVAEHDPEFGPATAEAWREVLAPGIAFMKARY